MVYAQSRLISYSPKVNLITRLEFELANFVTAIQDFNHYTTRIFLVRQKEKTKVFNRITRTFLALQSSPGANAEWVKVAGLAPGGFPPNQYLLVTEL